VEGGTLVCVTHLPRTPVRNSTVRNSFISASAANGSAAGNDTSSSGRDFKLTLDNTGAAIRKNNGITASIGNTQLTAGFNVMNMTLSNTGVNGTDIATGVNGISVKGWRYDSVLSNSNYNATGGAASSSLSLAQIRVGGNTDATDSSPINSHWYEGGLGDIFFFNRVLNFEERQLLEGWLSQKYGCNNTLGATITNNNGGTVGSSIHPYRLNPVLITPSNNLDLTSTLSPYAQNLVAWFDAANPNLINNLNITTSANATPPTNNTTVTRWAPTGGWWANTPLQLTNTSGTATYHSTTNLRTQNGLPGIYIEGSSNRLSLGTSTGSFSQYTTINTNTEFTWTIVFRPDSTPTNSTPVISVTSGTDNRLMLCSDGTFTYTDGTTSQTLAASPPLSITKTYMITVYRDGTTLGHRIVSEDISVGTQGFLSRTATQTNLSIPTFSSPTLTFGAIGVTGFTAGFTGSIFEATLFRSALSIQDIQQIEGYLAWKWGLQRSLPTRHAYKNVPA
jgi:hypothetical protein